VGDSSSFQCGSLNRSPDPAAFSKSWPSTFQRHAIQVHCDRYALGNFMDKTSELPHLKKGTDLGFNFLKLGYRLFTLVSENAVSMQ
jgi:hypothetical protein